MIDLYLPKAKYKGQINAKAQLVEYVSNAPYESIDSSEISGNLGIPINEKNVLIFSIKCVKFVLKSI